MNNEYIKRMAKVFQMLEECLKECTIEEKRHELPYLFLLADEIKSDYHRDISNSFRNRFRRFFGRRIKLTDKEMGSAISELYIRVLTESQNVIKK